MRLGGFGGFVALQRSSTVLRRPPVSGGGRGASGTKRRRPRVRLDPSAPLKFGTYHPETRRLLLREQMERQAVEEARLSAEATAAANEAVARERSEYVRTEMARLRRRRAQEAVVAMILAGGMFA